MQRTRRFSDARHIIWRQVAGCVPLLAEQSACRSRDGRECHLQLGAGLRYVRRMARSTATSLIVTDGAIRVSALLHAPPDTRACYVLAHGAGAGASASIQQEGRRGRSFSRAALAGAAPPVPVHGGRQEAARLAGARSRHRARRGRDGVARATAAAVHCGGKIVRGPHDVAGASGGSPARCARPRVFRLPAASGRTAVARARAASRRHRHSHAVPARDARRASRTSTRLEPAVAALSKRTRTLRLLASDADPARSMCRGAAGARMRRCSTKMLDGLVASVDQMWSSPSRASYRWG